MTSQHPSEPDSAANSVESTPRSDHLTPPSARWQPDEDAAATPRVRLMCSFGGRILPRPQDNQLRYVGGDTRIVAVHRSVTFSTLHSQLAKLAGAPDVSVKYQLPNEDLDALISVTTDDDVENMMEEYDRLAVGGGGGAAVVRTARLRLFLFSPGDAGAGEDGGFGSILDGLAFKRDSWFLDALNGDSASGRLERGRSEASSILSEIPDYLFGLDNNFDEPKPKAPGSPVPATPSPKYRSTSSAAFVPPIPDLPPLITKPGTTPVGPEVKRDAPVEPTVQQQAGYTMNQMWQYVQEPVPVYYMPGPVRGSNIPVRPPIPVQYFNQPAPVAGGQIPVGYGQPAQAIWTNPGHTGPVYVGGSSVGRAAVAGAYDYPTGPTVMVAEMHEGPADGGLPRKHKVSPVYPPATGVPPVGGDRR